MIYVCNTVILLLLTNVGSNGLYSDSQIFNECHLKQAIVDETMGFPDPDPLSRRDRDTPYFTGADDAFFALMTWLMKPFLGRNLAN